MSMDRRCSKKILHTDNNREPDYMLSFKQCTVLLFAGKLMWVFFSVNLNTN